MPANELITSGLIPDYAISLVNLFFPNRCVICQEEIGTALISPLCRVCKINMPLNDSASCKVCGEPIDGELPKESLKICGTCRITPPPFERTVSPLFYAGNSRKLMHQFKFRGKTGLAQILSSLMAARINRDLTPEELNIIIPVPLHIGRLWSRGYNQSYLLAKEIGNAFNIPVRGDVLIKPKNRGPQSLLSKPKREKNIRNAFQVKYPEAIKGKNVLIIDDLMTTGATMRETARTLKKAGANTIACCIAARA